MVETQGRQLEFQFADGTEKEGEWIITEQAEPAQRGPDGCFVPGNQCGKHSLTGAQREALEEIRRLAPKAAGKIKLTKPQDRAARDLLHSPDPTPKKAPRLSSAGTLLWALIRRKAFRQSFSQFI